MKMSYEEFRGSILDYFKDLPKERLNQGRGIYDECGCCVGAHLFHLFDLEFDLFDLKETDIIYHYQPGKRFFIRKMKEYFDADYFTINDFGNIDKPGFLFYFFLEAFKRNGHDDSDFVAPFSANCWPAHPYKIFKELFYLMDGVR